MKRLLQHLAIGASVCGAAAHAALAQSSVPVATSASAPVAASLPAVSDIQSATVAQLATEAQSATEAQNATEAQPWLLDPPTGDDYTAASLRAYQKRLLKHYGHYRDIPLDVKAAYFAWELRRYHIAPFCQVYFRVGLSDQVGERPTIYPDRDASTWNGALLGALAYQYAATHDPAVLDQIAELLEGLAFFCEVTRQPGLPARCVNLADGIVDAAMRPNLYVAPDGTRYHYEADPAKGGYAQLASGYAALMLHAYADLPPAAQRRAQQLVSELVMHMVDHDFRATYPDGRRTPYGDLTPLIGSQGVPFNAQVAYLIVALGHYFPPDDPAAAARVQAAFERLRHKHHCYYESPWKVVQPQRVGASPLLKGMNDRNHVMCAAFAGLTLDLHAARNRGQQFDERFVHQLGQTMWFAMSHADMGRHSLGNFQWAVIVRDPRVLRAVAPLEVGVVPQQVEAALTASVEQLRRFRLDRFQYPCERVDDGELAWNDEATMTDTFWKDDPRAKYRPTGPASNRAYAAMDYLAAYWLFRYYRLDQSRSLQQLNLAVLQPSEGLYNAPAQRSE